MRKHELIQALEPFTDEMEVLILAPGGYHGAADSFYGISTDGEGFLVLCLADKRNLSLRSATRAARSEA